MTEQQHEQAHVDLTQSGNSSDSSSSGSDEGSLLARIAELEPKAVLEPALAETLSL